MMGTDYDALRCWIGNCILRRPLNLPGQLCCTLRRNGLVEVKSESLHSGKVMLAVFVCFDRQPLGCKKECLNFQKWPFHGASIFEPEFHSVATNDEGAFLRPHSLMQSSRRLPRHDFMFRVRKVLIL